MKNLDNKLRWLLATAVLFGTFMVLLGVFFATQTFLQVWDRFQSLPTWLFAFFSSVVLTIVASSSYIIVRIIQSGKRKPPTPPTEDQLEAEIQKLEQAGIASHQFRDELSRLRSRKATGQIHIAFFGDVSTGKSSIIKALLPDAHVEINLRGGSTRETKEYTWTTAAGDAFILTDLPGRNEAEGELDEMARDEAVRAQIVVYVIDSDLSRSQFADILELYHYGKPMILAVNKSDLYRDTEKKQLAERIGQHFKAHLTEELKALKLGVPAVVFIQSGGTEEVLRINAQGQEELVQRPRAADVSALAKRLQKEIDSRMEWLEQLRDTSVFNLVQHKLDRSKVDYRRQEADKVVRTSTRHAMIGAMAAIAPGSDLIIQGVIGARMVQQLCKLYDVPVTQLDVDNFLKYTQGQLKTTVPLIMAVAGNGLKAFPGIGTFTGGLVHAVAYGIIFDALGHSVAMTLEERGSLKAAPAALAFREMLSGNMEGRAKTFAKLAIAHYTKKPKNQG